MSQLHPTVPPEAWAPFRQRYPEVFGGPDTWHVHFGGYLLRSHGQTILVDTGLGSHATNPGAVTAFPVPSWEETHVPLDTLGVLELVFGERTLTREITAIPAPGHTPGHTRLAIVSQGQHAVILGDLAVNPAEVTEPDWVFRFDMDQERAVHTRKQVLDRAEAEAAVLAACDYPAPGFGTLIRVQGRRYWQGL